MLTSGLVWGLSGAPASVCCSVAVSLWLCRGLTRSSWSPVQTGSDGKVCLIEVF